MRLEEFEFLYKLEETFWWFAGMRRITDTVVASKLNQPGPLSLLDAGCGAGFNIAHYSALGRHNVFGLDLSADAIAQLRRRGFPNVCQASVTDIPFASASFDLIFSFDVLCQGDQPPVESGLREMQRVLRPGGSLFIRVPAFRWMRSSHDVAVDTNRRFTRPELMAEIAKAGLDVQWCSYANCFLFPAVIVRRILKGIGIGRGSDVRPLPGSLQWIDPVFRRALETEAAIFRAGMRLPFGLSVICLATKRIG